MSVVVCLFQDGCIETWLPGRMESECILGEGIHFMFPNGTCNPFNPHSTGKNTPLHYNQVLLLSCFFIIYISELSTTAYIYNLGDLHKGLDKNSPCALKQSDFSAFPVVDI